MFKVPAGSIEEYLRFDPAREGDLRTLDETIRRAAPSLARWFVPGSPDGQPGMKMTMIGYGQYQYLVQSSDVPVTWPVLGLALQKNYISLYNSASGDGPPFTCLLRCQTGTRPGQQERCRDVRDRPRHQPGDAERDDHRDRDRPGSGATHSPLMGHAIYPGSVDRSLS